MEDNNNKISKNLSKMKLVAGLLNVKLNNITAKINEISKKIDIKILRSVSLNSALRTAEYVLNDLKESVTNLHTAIEATAARKLSPFFVSPELLQNVLKAIQPKLPNCLLLLRSVIDENIYIYYEVGTVRAAYCNEFLKLYMQIRLKAPGRYFSLYKVLPLPYKSHDMTTRLYIDTEFSYLAVSEDGQHYVEFNVEDFITMQG